ncbi:hypothetical protein [Vibrio phage phiKT1024]|nr:hypothetical protein [Vibrio phage phiKT1024]
MPNNSKRLRKLNKQTLQWLANEELQHIITSDGYTKSTKKIASDILKERSDA